MIPAQIREKEGQITRKEAFAAIHSPDSFTELAKARKYFIFEELFLFAMNIAGAKKEPLHEVKALYHTFREL